MRIPNAAKPFLVAQYRILVAALTLSMFGTGVWLIAVVFQVIDLGGGPVELSWVVLGSSVGLVAAVLFGGVVADRVPRRTILVAVESTRTAGAAVAATLSLTGNLELWHLIVIATILGCADGFFYPAYSALLPSVLPAEFLLAANGVEGMLRPVIMQAAGPAVASAIIAVFSPGVAFAVVAASQALAVGGLVIMRHIPVEREPRGGHPVRSMLSDLGAGFVYMVRTPWLFGTLLYASVLVFLIMGPIEVLLPFAVRDVVGADDAAASYALALASFGIGGAVGSLIVASLRLPRRYLTIMVLLWGAGGAPLAIIGFAPQLWLIIAAMFIVGFSYSAASVVWGTLLQRRVPSAMLGRVSSLDFFVSLVFMPISMALAGPVGVAIGNAPVFLVAGLAPVALAVLTIVIFRMPKDELAHPLDQLPEPVERTE